MLWTKDAEEALQQAEDDREIMPLTKKKFLNLLSILIKQTTYDLSKFDRIKYETLVTIHVHQSDIFNDLVGSFSFSLYIFVLFCIIDWLLSDWYSTSVPGKKAYQICQWLWMAEAEQVLLQGGLG